MRSGSRVSCIVTTIPLPFTAEVGFFFVGGERKMSELFLMTVYSSKTSVTLPLVSGKLVVYCSGVTFSSTGGMVSFGPPPGGVVVLAQEREKRLQQIIIRSRYAVVWFAFIID